MGEGALGIKALGIGRFIILRSKVMRAHPTLKYGEGRLGGVDRSEAEGEREKEIYSFGKTLA